MATYSYYLNKKWNDIKAKNINEVRAKLIKRYGKDLKTNKIGHIAITRNDMIVGELSYSRRYSRYEYGDDHVAYGEVIPASGRLVYDD